MPTDTGLRDFWAELSGNVLAHLLMGYMERHPERADPHAAFLGRGIAAPDIERHAEVYTAQVFATPEARALNRFLTQEAEVAGLARGRTGAGRGPRVARGRSTPGGRLGDAGR